MERNSEQLTIENLNEAYIRLIKLFMEGALPARTHQLTKFLNDPNPAEAFNILNQICPLKNVDKGLIVTNNQEEHATFKLKKAYTQIADEADLRSYPKLNGNPQETHSEGEIKIYSNRMPQNKTNSNTQKRANNQWQMRGKSDRLKSITNRLTQIFSGNQKKIDKYESIGNSNRQEHGPEIRNTRPVEVSVGYKKY